MRQQSNKAGVHTHSRRHLRLIGRVLGEFVPRFAPGAKLLHASGTEKIGHRRNREALLALGIRVDDWESMPDAVLLDESRGRLFLVDSIFGRGSIDALRREDLENLFSTAKAGRVYVTAFPTRALMARYLADIAWETEVWVAEAPTHMIHFNGNRFMGPR